MVILNNQHLGMVVQWEDRFYKHNRAHTYLGKEDAEWHKTFDEKDIYPDLPAMAASCGVAARRVIKKEDLRPAVRCLPAAASHFASLSHCLSWEIVQRIGGEAPERPCCSVADHSGNS